MLQLYGGGYLVALLQVCVVYYGASITLHWLAPRIWAVRSVQVQPRQAGQVRREAFYSLGPIAVKAAVLTAVERLHAAGITKLYDGPVQDFSQVLYMLATVATLDYLHDAWFYWTHRLLHSRLLYKHVHCVHHRSAVPTAFTGYSFHVAEAALVFANEVLVCFLFPIHAGLHRAYHLFTTIIHNGALSLPGSRGHAGFEIAPFIPSLEALGVALLRAADPRVDLAGALNTVRHHDMHHRFPARHFSLYFTHWDRWCGTEHPEYVAKVAEFSREGSKGPKCQGLQDSRRAGSKCGVVAVSHRPQLVLQQ